jgi:hypothetical protein
MQRFLDKWGLWIAFFAVGSVIAYGLIMGLTKEDESTKPKSAKNAAAEAAHGTLTPK